MKETEFSSKTLEEESRAVDIRYADNGASFFWWLTANRLYPNRLSITLAEASRPKCGSCRSLFLYRLLTSNALCNFVGFDCRKKE
jgi:hypothetical protein